jgi:hypothetical protein
MANNLMGLASAEGQNVFRSNYGQLRAITDASRLSYLTAFGQEVAGDLPALATYVDTNGGTSSSLYSDAEQLADNRWKGLGVKSLPNLAVLPLVLALNRADNFSDVPELVGAAYFPVLEADIQNFTTIFESEMNRFEPDINRILGAFTWDTLARQAANTILPLGRTFSPNRLSRKGAANLANFACSLAPKHDDDSLKPKFSQYSSRTLGKPTKFAKFALELVQLKQLVRPSSE